MSVPSDLETDVVQPSSKRGYRMNYLQVIYDIGNGDPKIKIKQGNREEWIPVRFPSMVASGAGDRLVIGGQRYVVGEDARYHTCLRTGTTAEGKIDNALPMLVEAIDRAVGWTQDYTVDVLYSCPSVKDYADRIKQQLAGDHKVTIMGQAVLAEPDQNYTLTVDKLLGQLECHLAYKLIPQKYQNKRRWLVDIGNRTIIITLVRENNRIDRRKVIDSCGVWSMLERIRESECLSGFPGMRLVPDEQAILDYLWGKNLKRLKKVPTDQVNTGAVQAAQAFNTEAEEHNAEVMSIIEAIKPAMDGCMSGAVAYLQDNYQQDDSIWLMGGGARLCGVRELIPYGPRLISKDPVWATVDGLIAASTELFARASN